VNNVKRGSLVLVVGPSGVGKDSLLEGARTLMRGQSGFYFPRRLITRPGNAGGEDHVALSEAEFTTLEGSGAFALHWRAHGLCYGILAAITDDLANGRHVVVNVSRSVIDEARARFSPVQVICVSVPPPLLAARLRARGRESEADIVKRLQQASAYQIADRPDTHVLSNEGPLKESVMVFYRLLKSIAGAAAGADLEPLRQQLDEAPTAAE